GGMTESLEAKLLASAEYFQKRGRRNKVRFLCSAAQDALGHPLDAATFQKYSALLNGSTPRLTVANLLLLHRKPAPDLRVGLARDTGISAADGITSDPTLTGTATAAAGPASVQGSVDGGVFFAVTTDAGGNFRFTPLAVNGSAEGSHTVRLQPTDQ